MNEIAIQQHLVLRQVVSELGLMMVRQDNDTREHLTRIEQSVEGMARNIEMLNELVRGLQINASPPQVQRATLIVARERPNLREEHVVPLHIESEDENEEGFGGDFSPRARNGNQQGESYKMRADLPFFSGVVDIEQFLDWIYEVERFFDIIRIEAERKVDFVAYKLRESAGARWQCHQDLLRTRGQPLIRNWT